MEPFRPVDDATTSIAVTSSSQRAFIGKSRSVLVTNIGSEFVWLRFGGASVVANTTTSVPFPPNFQATFGVDEEDTHCAVITDSSPGANTLHLTPGEGA